jgi:hypothetical protein
MAKHRLAAPMDQLESDIIETLIAGLQEWRPDLRYPESHSDMQGAVRGLLRMYDVRRLPIARQLEFAGSTVETSPVVPKFDCPFCEKKFLTAEVRSHHMDECVGAL